MHLFFAEESAVADKYNGAPVGGEHRSAEVG